MILCLIVIFSSCFFGDLFAANAFVVRSLSKQKGQPYSEDRPEQSAVVAVQAMVGN